MTQPSTSSPIELPFPIGGVHQGFAFGAQPPGTCPEARNVRSLTVGDRQRGGRRPGLSAAFSNEAGAVGARRINHLARMGRATLVSGDFVFLDTAVIADTFNRADGPPGGNYVYVCRFADPNGPSAWTGADAFATIVTNELILHTSPLRAGGQPASFGIMPHNGHTTASVHTRWRVKPNAPASSSVTVYGTWDAHEPCGMGPIVRCNEDMDAAIFACLIKINATTLRLRIVQITTGAGVTPQNFATLAESGDLTISGVNVQEGVAGDGAVDSLEIDLDDAGAFVVATARWNNQIPSDPQWAGISISATTDFRAGDRLAGVWIYDATTGFVAPSGERALGYMRIERFVPDTPNVLIQMEGTDSPLALRYQLPAGWRAVTHNQSTDAVTVQDGPWDSNSQPVFPAIDTTDQVIKTLGSANINTWNEREVPPDAPATVALQRPESVGFRDNAAYFRISADHRSYLRVHIRHLTGPPLGDGIYLHHVMRIDRIEGTVVTQLLPQTTILRAVSQLRDYLIVDARNGPDPNDTAIRIYMEGRLLFEWVPALGDLDALPLDSLRVGVGGAPSQAVRASAHRIRDGLADVALGDKIHYIAAFTNSHVSTGRIDIGTLSAVSGPALANRTVSTFSANLRMYAVDGAGAIVINPITGTSTEWATEVTASGVGVLPAECRLTALYRGRAVLARQPDNPSIWYMSRVGEPLDWDFGADPVATAAVAGTSALVGLPGDQLSALIPFADDYLIFGGASSIWLLSGDPGYGGTLNLLTDVTGIGAADSWCFDHLGNLWFMGNSGLYIMPRGVGEPQLVGGNRIPALLDRVDFDETIVHMAFDLFRREINIFLTPRDEATVGRHVAVQLDDQGQPVAFWIDDFPLDVGPFASLTMPLSRDEDRRPLLGGLDGWIRRQDDAALTDDGDPISSAVRYAPVELMAGVTEAMVDTIHTRLGRGSGDVTWAMLAGRSAEEVAALGLADAALTGVFEAGYNSPQSCRVRAGALQLILSHETPDETWSMEAISLWLRARGRRR